MIEEVDAGLGSWIRSVVGEEVFVSLDPPPALPAAAEKAEASSSGVSLYLLDLLPSPPIPSPSRGGRRPPLQFHARYLVSAWAAEPAHAHRLLADLAFSALGDGEMEVELDAVTPQLWLALGVAPRPAFLIRKAVRRERDEPLAPRVRLPIELETFQLPAADQPPEKE